MELKIGQINAQRLAAVAANLELIIKEQALDILCIQEPYTNKGMVKGYGTQDLRIIKPSTPNTWVAAVARKENMEIF
jgi:hypothetical protein